MQKGTDTVYSEVRNSKHGTSDILLLIQTDVTQLKKRNQATEQKKTKYSRKQD